MTGCCSFATTFSASSVADNQAPLATIPDDSIRTGLDEDGSAIGARAAP